MMQVRPSAMQARAHRRSRTTSLPTWRAAQAEKIVLAANKPGFRTLALRPPSIWGPGDPFSRALPQAINSGQFAFINRGDYVFDTCHVDNIFEAVQCALERGDGGHAFFITDQEKLTFREFVASLASLQGLSIEKLRSMPYGIASTLGRLMDAVWAIHTQRRRPADFPLHDPHDRPGVQRQ